MTIPSLSVNALLLCFLLCAITSFLVAQSTSLKASLENVSHTIQAEVGVAILEPESNDTISLNGDKHFPMQSIFKFHIALAALRLVDEGKLS